ncbi:GntR family transcriptional regulator [Geomonas sp. Red32]|uniref:GntR family transcriptional regulator n=1 Tax=Geomonas sp. Red32 TaxID=2912856 RepID=UPI00202CBEE2|nr:GntR family transcriptional regulator [Geomonas sp. Red32]MCM0081118.1 GntR family transcriptional regulator [Geomonas sp. Red32]
MNKALTEEEAAALPLSDRVFEQLQTAIVKGTIPAGSKISEPELAKSYGISRGTLREALSRLEERYLVVRSPNLGARVVTLSYEELIDIYQVREALGGMACGLAAVNMSDEEIADLGRLLDDHEKSIHEDEGSSYYQQEGEFDFHYRILQGSRNGKVISILDGGLYQLMRMYRYQFSTSTPRPLQALKEHRRIVEALAERDSELADLLMRRHIRAARKSIEERRQQSLERKG